MCVFYPFKLVHRLVVQSCADDIKRRHGDRHGDSADHGGDESGEAAVRTEPLQTHIQTPVHISCLWSGTSSDESLSVYGQLNYVCVC